ncbi:50S ribosomal protein L1 [bacterium]|nr:MAG: 50S ribosomal protein L1 [bacterium]
MRHGKTYRQAAEAVDQSQLLGVNEAVELLKNLPAAKFDESVDLAVKLGVDPRHADQMVRGTVVLPHGTGKTMRVLVLTQGPKVEEATAAGADHVGGDDYIEKIQSGWMDIDVIIATPDMMGKVGKLGRVLGPRGLMPNPKVGTVTMDVTKAVTEAKAGRVEYRVDKAGNIHCPVGRRSFEKAALVENVEAVLRELQRAKPAAAKGNYMQSCSISSTMSPSVKIDSASVVRAT